MCYLILEFTVFSQQSLYLWVHHIIRQYTVTILQLHYASLKMLDLSFLTTDSAHKLHMTLLTLFTLQYI